MSLDARQGFVTLTKAIVLMRTTFCQPDKTMNPGVAGFCQPDKSNSFNANNILSD
jgi:hypothetical protein